MSGPGDRLQALRLFIRVAESGSFSATAKEFDCAQATVSKQISDLESEFKTRFLTRTTRRIGLTDAGAAFYRRAKAIARQYDDAIEAMAELQKATSGVIRVASPILLGRKYIAPLVPLFHRTYPDLTIEHYLSDSEHDLVRDGIDVSIRIGELKDSSHQARRLGATRFITVAAPDFLRAHGTPVHPTDLQSVPCLIYLRFADPFEWTFKGPDRQLVSVRVGGPYRVDVYEAAYDAAVAGAGVLIAPLSACAGDVFEGKLVRILPDYKLPEVPIHAVTPASPFTPRKSRLLVDFLAAQFKANQWLSGKGGDEYLKDQSEGLAKATEVSAA